MQPSHPSLASPFSESGRIKPKFTQMTYRLERLRSETDLPSVMRWPRAIRLDQSGEFPRGDFARLLQVLADQLQFFLGVLLHHIQESIADGIIFGDEGLEALSTHPDKNFAAVARFSHALDKPALPALPG